MQQKSIHRFAGAAGLALAGLLTASHAALAADVVVSLTAKAATTTLPDGQTVQMWGLFCASPSNLDPATGASCSSLNAVGDGTYVAQSTSAWQPPLIIVNAGDNLSINLTNGLPAPVPTSLVIVGQIGGGLGTVRTAVASPTHAPQGTTWPGTPGDVDATTCAPGADPGAAGAAATFCPPGQGPRVQSFATQADNATTVALPAWSDLKAGTYLIESGTHPSIQGPMGLYGVLVVRGGADVNSRHVAYGGTSPVLYDADVPLLLSEIDPEQNAAVALAVATPGFSETAVWNGQAANPDTGAAVGCGNPSVHTCYPPAVNYDPRYYLINGVSFDRTAQAKSLFPVTGTAAAGTGEVLVRFVNAGLRMHAPSIVGAQTGAAGTPGFALIAEDGNVLPGNRRVQSDLLLVAGKTYDVMVNAPAAPAAGEAAAGLPVFDRQLSLSTNNQRDGGMLAYIGVNGGAAPSADSAVSAVTETYYCVAGSTLSVSDPGKGVLANDAGANGANLSAVALSGVPTIAPFTNFDFKSNGTFTYTQAPTATTCGGTFTYLVNGTTSVTASIKRCDAGSSADCPDSFGAPNAVADTYQGAAVNISSRLQVTLPGVLGNDSDPKGLALHACADSSCTPGAAVTSTGGTVTLGADGSFTASRTCGATCAAGDVSFTYFAANSQNRTASADVVVHFPASSNLAVNVKDAKTGAALTDYRWIIEEDRTVYIDPTSETNSATTTPRNLAVNFHTSHLPVIAQGCTGPLSCESGQSMLDPETGGHVPAVCDIGSGVCHPGDQKTAVDPKFVALDPTKRYYISVLPGDAANDAEEAPNNAHSMGGAQIATGQAAVDVSVQPLPFPTAKISVFVFEDDFPLNGENDTGGGVDVLAPNEPGLEGFNIVLLDQTGQFGDPAGQLTYDEFGMPVSNSLAHTIDPATGRDACPISASSADGIVGMIVTCPKYEASLPSDTPTTEKVLSPLAGHAVIANMYPGLYEVHTTPGADRTARGEEWLQTNTLDGTKDIEAFIKPDEPSYFQEFGPGGYHVAVGFANPQIINDRKATTACVAGVNCNGKFYGQVTSTRMSRTPDQKVYSSGSYDAYSFGNCYVSLGESDGADFAFTKCDANGNFQFEGIPVGNLRVTVFDQWNDLLVDGLSTPITAGTTGPGSSEGTRLEIPVTQWRTNLYGRIFLDQNGDNVSQDDEPGLPLVPYNIRYRDGSYMGFNNTDLVGGAGFNEVFPFLNWLVVDSDSARYKQTGVHVVYDAGGPVDGAGGGTSTIANGLANTIESSTAHVPVDLRVPEAIYCADADCAGAKSHNLTNPSTGRVDPGWVPSEGWQGLLGQNSFVEFSMRQFADHENGGIRGHVIYTSTRPFDDPALLLQLSWEPGVPNVKLNLYQEGTAADGSKSLTLVDTTTTTSWDDWAQGFRRNANGSFAVDGSGRPIPNMSCPGQETNSPFYFTMIGGTQALNPTTPMAEDGRFRCYDGWSMLNQVQPAPYNGMYKFPSIVAKSGATAALPTNDNWFLELDPTTHKTNCTICTTGPDGTPMLPAGKYVVEVVLPPGYELVKEEDKNILLGDVYIAPVEQQFAGFGNIYIMPDQAAVNAAYNPYNPIQSTANNNATPRHEGDTGSVEVFWPCVGAERIVPDFNSLFPGAEQQAPFAGATRPLCDRKEVTLEDQMTALAKFYVFTSAHVAGHFTGTITNDFASEFDPFSPQFGEKFAVPNAPVGFRDFTGKEVGRVYADQWGQYNGVNYSTWTVNPPSPSGYIPQMMIACMNDPGPILDTRPGSPTNGTMITDPAYNPAYSNFCYEIPFMPGQTAYLDTPVIPTMAFADGYNLPDCEYPDTTPAIKQVNGDGDGPWAAGADGTRSVTSLALTTAGNAPAYSQVPIIGFSGGGAGSSSAGAEANMHVSTLALSNRGGGYTGVPDVGFVGGAPDTSATATANMRVASITVDEPGSGYLNRDLNGAAAGSGVTLTGGGGSGATVAANNISLKVVALRINSHGTCTTPGNHNVVFTGGGAAGGGNQAAGTAVFTLAGGVTAINITDDGGNYQSVPNVNVNNCSESVTAIMGVRAINVGANGSGYTGQPTVNIAAAPAGGTNATATAFLNVNSLALGAGGAGYSKTPRVTFTGGGGTGAAATVSLRFDTTNSLVVTAGGGYTSTAVPSVTFTPSCSNNSSTVCATASLSGAVSGHTLTITALGDSKVLNHAYAGPQATTAPYNEKFITRHYGFGTQCTATGGACTAVSSVTIGGVNAPIVANGWTDGSIAVTVPSGIPACAVQPRGAPGTLCGELVITAGNGKKSIDTVVVNLGGKAPTHVGPNSPSYSTFGHIEPNPIQTAIDLADPGDLIIIEPGIYKENLLMWKPVRLQGVSAASVIINADAHPAGKLEAWRRQVSCLFGLALNGQPNTDQNPYDPTGTYSCPDVMRQHVDRIPFEGILGWDTTVNGNLAQMLQEPTLMGAYEGAGVTILGKGVWMSAGTSVADQFGAAAAGGFPADYRYLTAGTSGNNADCAIPASTTAFWREYYTTNFLCNPSRVDGISVINSSQGGGAIFAHGWNHNLEVANTRVHGNHGTLTGGITMGNGEFPDPFIVGGDVALPVGLPANGLRPGQASLAAGQQTGYGFNRNTRVHNNSVTSNLSVGDALYSGTPSAAGGVTFCVGADGYKFNDNWICGNMSSGDAGGVAHAGFINDGNISNNTIIFNQSQSPTIPTNGGGLAVLGASPDRTVTDPATGLPMECGAFTDVDCPPGLGEGTGRNLVIDGNLIMGNSAESGTGGGLRLQLVNGQDVQAFPNTSSRWNDVTVINNIVSDNVAGWDGGGVSLQDAIAVKFVNNTVVANDTTASAGVLFNTLGAPLASVPGPNCHLTPTPEDPNHFTCDDLLGSNNQVAGFVTMAHTPNLMAATGGVSCPSGYGYSGTNCRRVSLPLLSNNLFWQNRTFHITVAPLAAGAQQAVVTLTPTINQTATGMCAPPTADPANYWDIGVRGDTGPTNHIVMNGAAVRLSPASSILTGGDYSGSGNIIGSNPALAHQYCNGARMPPEHCAAVTDPIEHLRCLGYNVPPGHSEATGLYPVFTVSSIVPAATVDEGNNWINLGFGPLSLSNAATYTAPNTALAPLGDYSINPGPAVSAANGGVAPNHDFFNHVRPQGTGVDIGAVEVGGSGSGGGGSGIPTLTGLDNFNRATALNLNVNAPTGVSWTESTVLGAQSIGIIDVTGGNISTGVATTITGGTAYFNTPTSGFGSKQAAALVLGNTNNSGVAVLLKSTGTTNGTGVQQNSVRVQYTTAGGGTITVATTTNNGGTYTAAAGGTITGFGGLATGDTLTAMVDATGVVSVWKTAGGTSTLLGTRTLPSVALWTTGGGRIGIQMPALGRVDNFAGGTVP